METTIQEAVAQKIAGSGETVKNTVVDILANGEINKRVDSITKAISKIDLLEKEYKKINKSDITTYVNNAPVESMSQNRFNDIKKSKDKFDNLTNAFNIALETNTQEAYDKLSGILKSLENAASSTDQKSGNQKTEPQS